MALSVRDLQLQVEALQAELAGKDGEVAALTEATLALQSQDLQAAKIIDLSKKNRALNLALEREKQRSAKLQADLSAGPSGRNSSPGASSAAPPEAIEQIARGLVEQAAEAAETAQREAAQWKDKLQQTTNRIAQLEHKAFTLEAENKKLARAITREVGEDVPLAKVLEDGSDWRGRREQLIALKDQVKQLKAAAGQASDSRQEQAAKNTISKISKERSAELDRLSGDLVATKAELEATKLKCDAAVSRRKTLENDLSSMKQKVAVILEKTQMDDRLIAALKAELAQVRRGGTAERGPKTDDELWQQLGALRRRCGDQEEQIDRQEAIILALQQRAAASAASTPTGAGLGAPGGARPWDGGGGAMDQQMRLLEVENGRLQELVALLKGRLDAQANLA